MSLLLLPGPRGLRQCSHGSCPCRGPSPTQVAWSPPRYLPWLTTLHYGAPASPQRLSSPSTSRAWELLGGSEHPGLHRHFQNPFPTSGLCLGHCPCQAALTWSSCPCLNTSWDGELTFLVTQSVSQWRWLVLTLAVTLTPHRPSLCSLGLHPHVLPCLGTASSSWDRVSSPLSIPATSGRTIPKHP